MPRRRVFITGIGLVSPHGEDPQAVFERVCAGESCVRSVRTGTPEFGADVLLAVVDFDPKETIPKAQRVFMARAAQMAVSATHHALSMAGQLRDEGGPEEAGIYIGCGLGGSEAIQDGYRRYFELRSRRTRPTTVPLIMANGPASHVSMRFGLRGPSHTYSVACASSTVSVGEAFRAVRDGYLDVAVAGGTEAMLNDGSIAAWVRMGVLASPHPDGDDVSCRPFDASRSGFALGEGAAILVLESEERARLRGAHPIAEIVGYGASSDAHGLTEPHAEGQAESMRSALLDAELDASRVGYVNAHATGTVAGDPVEIQALREVFGNAANGLAVSATKAVHGHLVGAAGALETAITAMALEARRIPPTAHCTDPDPACDLDVVPVVARDAPELDVALTNSFAFGGSNASLVLRRIGEESGGER